MKILCRKCSELVHGTLWAIRKRLLLSLLLVSSSTATKSEKTWKRTKWEGQWEIKIWEIKTEVTPKTWQLIFFFLTITINRFINLGLRLTLQIGGGGWGESPGEGTQHQRETEERENMGWKGQLCFLPWINFLLDSQSLVVDKQTDESSHWRERKGLALVRLGPWSDLWHLVT